MNVRDCCCEHMRCLFSLWIRSYNPSRVMEDSQLGEVSLARWYPPLAGVQSRAKRQPPARSVRRRGERALQGDGASQLTIGAVSSAASWCSTPCNCVSSRQRSSRSASQILVEWRRTLQSKPFTCKSPKVDIFLSMADSVRDEGYSLWLIPPESSSLFEALQELIEFAIPSIYPGTLTPSFTPHVTLTAGMIDPELVGQDPQAWLDNLAVPRSTSNLKVTISELHIGSIFFQKLIMLCEKSSELCDFAMFCRALGTMEEESANDWVQENYRPHCSLM